MDFAGAGKAAYRLHRGLREIGVDSSMVVMCKKTTDGLVYELPSDVAGSPDKWWGLLSSLWQKKLLNYPDRGQDSELFSDFFAAISLEPQSEEIRSADIVNLHWVAGLFDDIAMPRILYGKKVIWTLHDMNPFTGGCHYSAECTRFEASCGECPQIVSADPEDISFAGWLQKRNAYRNLDITVVSPSRWLGACSSKSSLLGHFHHRIIPNGLPLNTFKPLERQRIRAALGIKQDARIVLFCADSTSTRRKGFSYLLDALYVLSESGRGNNLTLAIVGSHDSGPDFCGYPELIFGHIDSEEQMAVIYNLADVFVLPSLEDNLPNTVVEALGCGTPIAAFDVGGVPDMVDHKVTGYLAQTRDVTALAGAIEWCINSAPADIRQKCRDRAETFFSLEAQANNYLELYESVCSCSDQKVLALHINPLPPISIVTPSLNQAQYLEECIDSILSQNYPNLEYIIMDGGSTDGSVEIIRKYEKYLKFWESRPDNGQYAAIDAGLRISTGTVMTWLNSDDVLHPGALKMVAELFAEQAEVSWITGRPNGLGPQGRQSWVLDMLPLWSREKYLSYEYYSPFIQQEGTFWCRRLWEKAGGYIRHDLKYAGDLELWTRFFRYAQLYSVDALIAGYRQHPQQKMAGFLEQYHQEAKAVLDFERELFQCAQDRQLRPAPLPIIPKQKDRYEP